MQRIEGSPENLKPLLQNTKYSIHYYQREYMWQRKHIEELIDDLTSESLIITKPETLVDATLMSPHSSPAVIVVTPYGMQRTMLLMSTEECFYNIPS